MLWIALLKRYLMWSFQHYEMGIFLHEDMRCRWRNLPTEESSSHSLAPAGNSCTRPLHPPPAPKPPRGLSPGPLTLTCLGLGVSHLFPVLSNRDCSPGCSDRLRESQSDPLTLSQAWVRGKHVLFSTHAASGVNSARWKLPSLCRAEPNILRSPRCKKSWETLKT